MKRIFSERKIGILAKSGLLKREQLMGIGFAVAALTLMAAK